jgi:hypothetical protein
VSVRFSNVPWREALEVTAKTLGYVVVEERYGVPGEVMYPNRSEELQPRALDDSLVLRASIQRHEARGERMGKVKIAE